jgi:hypothetical protein
LTVALTTWRRVFCASTAPSTSNCQNTRFDSNSEYLSSVARSRSYFISFGRKCLRVSLKSCRIMDKLENKNYSKIIFRQI